MVWVHDEWNYDRFHEDLDRIHQVMRVRAESNGTTTTSPHVTVPITQALEEGYPAVESTVVTSWEEQFVVTRGSETARLDGYHDVEADVALANGFVWCPLERPCSAALRTRPYMFDIEQYMVRERAPQGG